MLITKKLVKFNNLIIKISKQTNNLKDLSENRWGYKYGKKTTESFIQPNKKNKKKTQT